MNLKDFRRIEQEGLVYYSCAAFERLAGVRHGFSTRIGRTGSLNLTALAGDSGERVEENRRRFLAALGLDGMPLATLAQLHSDRVQTFIDGDEDLNRCREGDALITRRSGLALGVQVADCFPVLLADEESGTIAAVHSGWRGTAARILMKTIGKATDMFGVAPSKLSAAIGPGIRSCCMQVGEEVARKYLESYPGLSLVLPQPGHEGRYLADLPCALKVQLYQAGLHDERIFDLDACTRCLAGEFFSYRAEGQAAGRMMAVIGRSA